MPRIVDHDERRREIAQAAWDVINRSGIEEASLHAIAASLNLTTGAVAHYFKTKEALIAHAFEVKTGEAFIAIDAKVARLKPGIDRLRVVLELMTPALARPRKDEGGAIVSYWGLAVQQPLFSELHRALYARLRSTLRQHLAEAFAETNPTLDLDLEVNLLVAFMDGVQVGSTLEPSHITRNAARKMLEATLARIGNAN